MPRIMMIKGTNTIAKDVSHARDDYLCFDTNTEPFTVLLHESTADFDCVETWRSLLCGRAVE